MKKKFIALGLGLTLLSFSMVSAAEYAKSDIDEDASTITIDLSPATGSAGYSCEYSNRIENKTESFEQKTAYSFTSTGWDSATGKFEKLINCFLSSGDYTLDIKVVDKAGNESSYTENFTINPGTPTQGIIDGDCDATADYSDKCIFSLTLKDKYGNTATNQQPKIYSESTLANDANLETSFREGLILSSTNDTLPQISANAESLVGNKFELKALSPSIQKETVTNNGITAILSRLVSPIFNFIFTNIKEVESDGTLSSKSAEDVTVSKSIRFKNPFSAKPTVGQLELQEVVSISINSKVENGGATIDEGSGTLKTYDLLDNLCDRTENRDGTYSFTNCDIDPDDNRGTTFAERDVNIEGRYLKEGNGSTLGDESVALNTTISYGIGHKTISYVAGAVGGLFDDISNPSQIIGLNDQSIETKFIGADIEGFVSVDTEKVFLGSDGKQILNIGLNSNKTDIYEEIVKNGFELVRNSKNKFDSKDVSRMAAKDFAEKLFRESDIAVVDLSSEKTGLIGLNESPNMLEISGTLPRGQNTLIVINGNLKITGDLKYSNKNDSFGVIVLRTTAGTYPESGNIFVAPEVQKITGSFFADGGFMDNNGDEISTGNTNTTTNQLLLEGSLLSRNTLGGSLRGNDDDSVVDYTPWEETDDDELARRYDLHYVRRYDYEDRSHVGIEEELNNAAFIIRPDQKSTILSPPGFKIQ